MGENEDGKAVKVGESEDGNRKEGKGEMEMQNVDEERGKKGRMEMENVGKNRGKGERWGYKKADAKRKKRKVEIRKIGKRRTTGKIGRQKDAYKDIQKGVEP